MNTNTLDEHYEDIRASIAALTNTRSISTWALADLLFDTFPGDEDSAEVHSGLSALAVRLAADGVTNYRGNPYSVSSLQSLRRTASRWPQNTRFFQAPYSAHREAGDCESRGAHALAALVKVAKGESTPDTPVGVHVRYWHTAVQRVQRRADGLVSSRDVRVALGQDYERDPGLDEVLAAVEGGNLSMDDIELPSSFDRDYTAYNTVTSVAEERAVSNVAREPHAMRMLSRLNREMSIAVRLMRQTTFSYADRREVSRLLTGIHASANVGEAILSGEEASEDKFAEQVAT